ncbi:hypothetical protein DPMN_016683 [Dreissena polymorpha]|uniref:Uncharacterized protein n=1 Tax=Dreissena polymorpha TaxID=45954 RepID=A0A9D4NF97_DREPO|nr:hypothetical protein DPMN_016683 [Dreissena polymorpha]
MLQLDGTYPSLEDIEKTDDLLDLLLIAEEHHVQFDDLSSVPELKERLVLEYWRRKGRRPYVEVRYFGFCWHFRHSCLTQLFNLADLCKRPIKS